eukprot:CAMPEP_0183362918 /NCGR_PEP_ID=MMETSP0164_2-20130417/72354_1 /TAXON_ID=221442 /ORGANISM="Coccolithus pelagicus ssp braarudi, Strain PLY182g" /LENGTH=33 /DNA_ID= /DNA_START= /DNA_END= /DNA_ORIENTATION=
MTRMSRGFQTRGAIKQRWIDGAKVQWEVCALNT